MDKLYIVIPAYNEAENIVSVAREWHEVVKNISEDSRLVIIDDGSKDNTYSILNGFKGELPQLTAITKPNGGHGATVLYGYNYALSQGADYVFQTDSDGQTIPSEFREFWESRQMFSAVIGYRNQRKDGVSRIFVSKVLKTVLWSVFKLNIPDANTPFRLIKSDVLKKYVPKIPHDFNLSNVLLTVFLVKYEKDVKFIPITFRPRQGGINSINLRKIVKLGFQAIKDFLELRKMMK
ncbi:MAG: glycosyltransferase family 2 protein [Tannerella sp.]|jgi:glycosyltransferase involved in cell wall biosynthesis|nr:glycosyltransferase family 2 protein [Tannerella sp.]